MSRSAASISSMAQGSTESTIDSSGDGWRASQGQQQEPQHQQQEQQQQEQEAQLGMAEPIIRTVPPANALAVAPAGTSDAESGNKRLSPDEKTSNDGTHGVPNANTDNGTGGKNRKDNGCRGMGNGGSETAKSMSGENSTLKVSTQSTGSAQTSLNEGLSSYERRQHPLPEDDPLLIPPSPVVRENDYVLLLFGDGRQIFAHCVTSWKGKTPPVKINKRSYPTANLVGLPYGTVLELDHTRGGLVPLPDGEDVLPDLKGTTFTEGTAVGSVSVGNTSSADGGGSVGGGSVGPSSGEECDYGTSGVGRRIGKRPNPSRCRDGVDARINSSDPIIADHAPSHASDCDATTTDNRHLVDANNAQAATQATLMRMRYSDHGSHIVQHLIDNSSTFHAKTPYSRAKYVARKQKKYQPRCRMVRCTGSTISEAMFLKNPRAVLNLREDTLAQILSYANVYAGCQVLVMEGCQGIITAALAQRMGGYGKILSVYAAQQPPWMDTIKKFNLSFAEHHSIKWIHSGEVFGTSEEDNAIISTVVNGDMGAFIDRGGAGCNGGSTATHPKPGTTPCNSAVGGGTGGGSECVSANGRQGGLEGKQQTPNPSQRIEIDSELLERRELQWPCPLQDHTRRHLSKMSTSLERAEFLGKRCNRFARKLTRHTAAEAKGWLRGRSDALIVACRYDPTETTLGLLPYLAASCPFVVFCEHLEPLVETFRELQKQNLAINLRLGETWLREYQVLPGRTHPNMNMSQSGGYLLSGIKLCPVTGQNELQEDVLRDLRAQVGGRRGRKKSLSGDTKNGRGKGKKGVGGGAGVGNGGHSGVGDGGGKGGRDFKRARFS